MSNVDMSTASRELVSLIGSKGITVFDWSDFVFEHHVSMTVFHVDQEARWKTLVSQFLVMIMFTQERLLNGIYVVMNKKESFFRLHCCYGDQKGREDTLKAQ